MLKKDEQILIDAYRYADLAGKMIIIDFARFEADESESRAKAYAKASQMASQTIQTVAHGASDAA